MADRLPPKIHFEYCLDENQGKPGVPEVIDGAIKSVSINYMWYYFFHESLIAIRHQLEPWSYYVRLKDCEKVEPEYHAHTIEQLTQYHLDICARDFGGDEGRKVEIVPLEEICELGCKLAGDEIIKLTARGFGLETEDTASDD